MVVVVADLGLCLGFPGTPPHLGSREGLGKDVEDSGGVYPRLHTRKREKETAEPPRMKIHRFIFPPCWEGIWKDFRKNISGPALFTTHVYLTLCICL